MKGRLYIDGNDAFEKYGVFVTEGGYNQIVMFPKQKEYKKNNWKECNGIETDNEKPILNGRNININFGINGGQDKYDSFVADITDVSYHVFYFAYIGISIRLRLVSATSYQMGRKIGVFAFNFADDFYLLEDYTYEEPFAGAGSDYVFNGKPLKDYGITMSDNSAWFAEKLSKRANGATVAGLVIGSAGLLAGIGAWIYAGTYASAKSKANERAIDLLAQTQLAERQSRETWQGNNQPSLQSYIDVQTNPSLYSNATSQAQALASIMNGNNNGQTCPTPVALYQPAMPCSCNTCNN